MNATYTRDGCAKMGQEWRTLVADNICEWYIKR